MKTRKIWANFSVKDVERTSRFYHQLGFTENKSAHPGLASFFFGDDRFVIHFFQQGSQIDAYLPPGATSPEVIFTLAASSREEADQWKEKVQAAGGTIYGNDGQDTSGYYGFMFADPDGHRFNVLVMEEGM
ncbi:VOC family protein [Chitinophaga caseinilytica]|uniref:VOC family protein n=1 Tax=Chitinophaga caseinilytica TaxID=2267521 RepID=UPI003C2EAE52